MEADSNTGFTKLFMENWKDTFVDGASGALAGFISSLLLHPLENIRARLQDVQLSDQQVNRYKHYVIIVEFKTVLLLIDDFYFAF